MTNVNFCKVFFIINHYSFLYPDGRILNPDLSFLVADSEEDHIRVTQVIGICNAYKNEFKMSKNLVFTNNFQMGVFM